MGATVRPVIGVALTLAILPVVARGQTNPCLTIPDAAPIAWVGEFTDMRHTAEHSYGFSVTLWRAGECLVGVLASAGGLSGDTPVGLMQDVKYDRSTGRLSFAAKLTTGVTSPPGSKTYEPARDFYTFDGRLSAATLTGAITHELRNYPNVAPTKTDVTLSLSKSEMIVARTAASYGQWQLEWRPILAARGPKW